MCLLLVKLLILYSVNIRILGIARSILNQGFIKIVLLAEFLLQTLLSYLIISVE